MLDLNDIKNRITAYEIQYGRTPGSVSLLAVSKQQSLEHINALIDQGQRLFGENYLQEALEKMTSLTNPALTWYFIGHIQTNKARKITEHFSWVLSVESEAVAKRLNDYRPKALPPLNVCIEVNISGESSKSGVTPDKLLALATFCRDLPCLKLRGLMCIPAITHDFQKQREQFRRLYQLYDGLKQQGFDLDTLSMGMSDDFEAAIAEGATLIRLGSALFGARESKTS